jgi:hypothetical protein
VIDGKFERNSRSRVLYLHPGVTKAKMTREFMRNIVETSPPATVQRQYLDHCWIPRELAERWCRSHNIRMLTRPKKQGGRRPYDDSAALAKMRELFAEGIESEREAAKIAAAFCGSPGASTEAKIDRLRGKFARGAAK